MSNVDWVPNVSDVGAQLRSRTKDRNGNELGTFTSETRPTDTQVAVLARSATGRVEDAVGMTIPAGMEDRARDVAALGTALLVELAYYPEQVATGRSPYTELKTLYDEDLGRLTAAASAAGDPDAADGMGSLRPAGGFGDNGPVRNPYQPVTIPIVRVDWRTPW